MFQEYFTGEVMTRKRTRDEIEEIVNELGYELLDIYNGKHSERRVIVKDNLGYKYNVRLDAMNNLKMVHTSNLDSLENISTWLKLNNKEFILCEDNIYEGSHTPLQLYHFSENCREYFHISWNNLFHGQGCGVCNGKQVGKYSNLSYCRPDLALEWHPDNELSPEEVTEFSNKKAYWICSVCKYGKNKEWFSVINSRSGKSGTGCPRCRDSKGEKRVENFLLKYSINYEKQFRFDDCRDIRVLKFDFAVLNENLLFCLIEYDGETHFIPYNKSPNANEKLKDIKRKDKIKNKYCNDNNINLLRIPYWEFDNIEKILTETFFE